MMDFNLRNSFTITPVADLCAKLPCDAKVAALYEDSGRHLMVESVNLEEIEATYFDGVEIDHGGAMMLEAITTSRVRLDRTMAAFVKALNQQLGSSGLTVMDSAQSVKTKNFVGGAVEIGKVRKTGGLAVIPVVIPLSDGQSITVMFHSPTNDPAKISSNDTLVAFRFLLNKRDVTHVVSPDGGRDISLKQTCLSLANLAERNSGKFQAAKERTEKLKNDLASYQAQAAQLDGETAELAERGDNLEKSAADKQAEADRIRALADKQEGINEDLRAQIANAQARKAEDEKAKAEQAAKAAEEKGKQPKDDASADEGGNSHSGEPEPIKVQSEAGERLSKLNRSLFDAVTSRLNELYWNATGQKESNIPLRKRVLDQVSQARSKGFKNEADAAIEYIEDIQAYLAKEKGITKPFFDKDSKLWTLHSRATVGSGQSGIEVSGERLKALSANLFKSLRDNLSVIYNIDTGNQQGSTRSLFVSSAVNMIKRYHKNGKQEAVDAALEYIEEMQSYLEREKGYSKALITQRNSVWRLHSRVDERNPEVMVEALIQARNKAHKEMESTRYWTNEANALSEKMENGTAKVDAIYNLNSMNGHVRKSLSKVEALFAEYVKLGGTAAEWDAGVPDEVKHLADYEAMQMATGVKPAETGTADPQVPAVEPPPVVEPSSTDTGERYYYGLRARPAGAGATPALGLVEVITAEQFNQAGAGTLESEDMRHGVAVYNRRLSEGELKQYELVEPSKGFELAWPEQSEANIKRATRKAINALVGLYKAGKANPLPDSYKVKPNQTGSVVGKMRYDGVIIDMPCLVVSTDLGELRIIPNADSTGGYYFSVEDVEGFSLGTTRGAGDDQDEHWSIAKEIIKEHLTAPSAEVAKEDALIADAMNYIGNASDTPSLATQSKDEYLRSLMKSVVSDRDEFLSYANVHNGSVEKALYAQVFNLLSGRKSRPDEHNTGMLKEWFDNWYLDQTEIAEQEQSDEEKMIADAKAFLGNPPKPSINTQSKDEYIKSVMANLLELEPKEFLINAKRYGDVEHALYAHFYEAVSKGDNTAKGWSLIQLKYLADDVYAELIQEHKDATGEEAEQAKSEKENAEIESEMRERIERSALRAMRSLMAKVKPEYLSDNAVMESDRSGSVAKMRRVATSAGEVAVNLPAVTYVHVKEGTKPSNAANKNNRFTVIPNFNDNGVWDDRYIIERPVGTQVGFGEIGSILMTLKEEFAKLDSSEGNGESAKSSAASSAVATLERLKDTDVSALDLDATEALLEQLEEAVNALTELGEYAENEGLAEAAGEVILTRVMELTE